MSRRVTLLIVSAAAVAALGVAAAVFGPVLYRDYFTATPEDAPTLTAESDSDLTGTSGEALDPAALTGTWSVAGDSEAGYRVDEVLNGTPVTVTGRTSEVTGTATVDALTLTGATFTVDVASIATDSDQRDRYFRDSALRTDDYPTATFVLGEPLTLSAAPTSGETVEQEVTGELTLAGVTRTVTFTAQARTDGTTAEIAGQIPITFADFGVEAPDLGFVSVESAGFVEFDLQLQQS